jgi:hypothetical protein
VLFKQPIDVIARFLNQSGVEDILKNSVSFPFILLPDLVLIVE